MYRSRIHSSRLWNWSEKNPPCFNLFMNRLHCLLRNRKIEGVEKSDFDCLLRNRKIDDWLVFFLFVGDTQFFNWGNLLHYIMVHLLRWSEQIEERKINWQFFLWFCLLAIVVWFWIAGMYGLFCSTNRCCWGFIIICFNSSVNVSFPYPWVFKSQWRSLICSYFYIECHILFGFRWCLMQVKRVVFGRRIAATRVL